MCEGERGPACVTAAVPWRDDARQRTAGGGRAPLQRRARLGCETRGAASAPAAPGIPPIPLISPNPGESHLIPLIPWNPTCPVESRRIPHIPLHPT